MCFRKYCWPDRGGRFKISVLPKIIALPKIFVTLCGLFLKSSFTVSRFAFLGEKIGAEIPSRIISKGYRIHLSSLCILLWRIMSFDKSG